ncbi:MAG: sulfotransferase [Chloroflexi bacterium]|nr:sulfotransferase [Chloroflexota bacterium]
MRNCLVLGAGRSGTSMVAGTLSEAGYYMGDTMMPATEANPKGFFESREVEALNEDLIRTMLQPTLRERLSRWAGLVPPQPNFEDAAPWAKVLWLAMVAPEREPAVSTAKAERIARLTHHEPYCLKDPRLCYTLPAWRKHLQNTVFICVFREPATTATSILKEVEREDYLKGIRLSYRQALEIWMCNYRHILEKHRHQGDWMFLHYNQVLTSDGLDRIAALTGAKVNRDFPDERLARTTADDSLTPLPIRRVYQQLCELAGHTE